MAVEKPDGILLDLDGTLLDSEESARSAVAATATAARDLVGIAPELWAAANAEAFGEAWSQHGSAWELGVTTSAELSNAVYASTLDRLGADRSLASTFSRLHAEQVLHSARLFEDAEHFLRAVSAAGIPFAIVTNGGDSQRDVINAARLAGTPAYVYISSEHGKAKPDPVVFVEVCAALSLDRRRGWHVGDSLSTDVAGAAAVGLATVWVNRNKKTLGASPRPTACVADLSELAAVIGTAPSGRLGAKVDR